jgi:hypothetical protein
LVFLWNRSWRETLHPLIEIIGPPWKSDAGAEELRRAVLLAEHGDRVDRHVVGGAEDVDPSLKTSPSRTSNHAV